MFTIVLARSSTTEGEVGLRAAARKRLTDFAHHHGGAQSVAGDVADRKRDAAVGEREGVVPIAAHDRFFGGRNVRRIEMDALVLGQPLGQERALERVGHVVLALVDLGAVDRHRNAQREFVEQLPFEFADRRCRGDDRERADGPLAGDERKRQAVRAGRAGRTDRHRCAVLDQFDGESGGKGGYDEAGDALDRRPIVETGRECFTRGR